MKKLFSVFVLFFLSFTLLNAQGKLAVGGGLELGLPQGDWSDFAGTGIGFTARGEYTINENLTGIATVGYINFGGDENQFVEISYSAIPILGGVKYYFQGAGFYAQGELGFHLLSVDSELKNTGGFSFSGTSSSATETEFSLGLGGGYEYPLTPKIDLDATAKYMIVSDANYINIRVGAKFNLN
jgi:opacity protein-like surface antigen